MKTKKTATVSETTMLVTLRIKTAETRRAWCDDCAAEVVWLDVSETIGFFDIFDLSEKCAIHFNGNRVCSRSLFEKIKNLWIKKF